MDGRGRGRTDADADFIAVLARRRCGRRLMPMCQNIAKSVRPIYGERGRAGKRVNDHDPRAPPAPATHPVSAKLRGCVCSQWRAFFASQSDDESNM